jgi:hypothetical protein
LKRQAKFKRRFAADGLSPHGDETNLGRPFMACTPGLQIPQIIRRVATIEIIPTHIFCRIQCRVFQGTPNIPPGRS